MIQPAKNPSFPLTLPTSLVSYNELYQQDSEEAIKRLEAQAKKRGNDPLCYMLLAWFYLHTGNREMAYDQARKARCFAPGSPFLEYVVYMLEHPDGFDVKVPEHPFEGELPGFFMDRALSLDELIERLSDSDSTRFSMSESRSPSTTVEFDAQDADDRFFATETLAKIYESQGETGKAIAVYERLLETDPDKSDHFAQHIERLRSN